MSTPRLAWVLCELSVLALALCAQIAGGPHSPRGEPPLKPVGAPSAQVVPHEGGVELRTLVLHPDVEESFPARPCEAQGLSDEQADCSLPPLTT